MRDLTPTEMRMVKKAVRDAYEKGRAAERREFDAFLSRMRALKELNGSADSFLKAYSPGERAKGRAVEMEHTADPAEADRIAEDHLDEDPAYYSKLDAAGLADGGKTDDNPHDLVAEAMLAHAEESLSTGADPLPGLDRLRDLLDDPAALADLLGQAGADDATVGKCFRVLKGFDESKVHRDHGKFASRGSKSAHEVSDTLGEFAKYDGSGNTHEEYTVPAASARRNALAAAAAAKAGDHALAREYHKDAADAHDAAAEGHDGWSGRDVRHAEAARLHRAAAARHRAAAGIVQKAWNEADHPRGKGGHFISKDRIEAAKTDPKLAKELRAEVKPEDAGKLDAALEGKTDLGRTKRGQAKHEAAGRRATKDEAKAKTQEFLTHFRKVGDLKADLTADHLYDLAEHLKSEHVTIDDVRQLRTALHGAGGGKASFGGQRKRQALVDALRDHARGRGLKQRAKELGLDGGELSGAVGTRDAGEPAPVAVGERTAPATTGQYGAWGRAAAGEGAPTAAPGGSMAEPPGADQRIKQTGAVAAWISPTAALVNTGLPGLRLVDTRRPSHTDDDGPFVSSGGFYGSTIAEALDKARQAHDEYHAAKQSANRPDVPGVGGHARADERVRKPVRVDREQVGAGNRGGVGAASVGTGAGADAGVQRGGEPTTEPRLITGGAFDGEPTHGVGREDYVGGEYQKLPKDVRNKDRNAQRRGTARPAAAVQAEQAAAADHRSAVESALAAGKPVPADVLADYPDLAPAPAPPAATPPAPAPTTGVAADEAELAALNRTPAKKLTPAQKKRKDQLSREFTARKFPGATPVMMGGGKGPGVSDAENESTAAKPTPPATTVDTPAGADYSSGTPATGTGGTSGGAKVEDVSHESVAASFNDIRTRNFRPGGQWGGAPIVSIPELYDHLKGSHPGLTLDSLHDTLKRMQDDDKLTLEPANDPRFVPRREMGIQIPNGLAYTVQMRNAPTPAPGGTPGGGKVETTPAVKAARDKFDAASRALAPLAARLNAAAPGTPAYAALETQYDAADAGVQAARTEKEAAEAAHAAARGKRYAVYHDPGTGTPEVLSHHDTLAGAAAAANGEAPRLLRDVPYSSRGTPGADELGTPASLPSHEGRGRKVYVAEVPHTQGGTA